MTIIINTNRPPIERDRLGVRGRAVRQRQRIVHHRRGGARRRRGAALAPLRGDLYRPGGPGHLYRRRRHDRGDRRPDHRGAGRCAPYVHQLRHWTCCARSISTRAAASSPPGCPSKSQKGFSNDTPPDLLRLHLRARHRLLARGRRWRLGVCLWNHRLRLHDHDDRRRCGGPGHPMPRKYRHGPEGRQTAHGGMSCGSITCCRIATTSSRAGRCYATIWARCAQLPR